MGSSAAGQLQWDGQYLAIEDSATSPSQVYQFSIGASGGTEVGSLVLEGSKDVAQFWIQGNNLMCAMCGEPLLKRRRRHCEACMPKARREHGLRAIEAARKALAAQAAAGNDRPLAYR